MKWQTEPRIWRLGDKRRRRHFALLPKGCNDGFTHWLCDVVQVQTLDAIVNLPFGIAQLKFWSTAFYEPAPYEPPRRYMPPPPPPGKKS